MYNDLEIFGRGDKMQVTEKINALRKIMGDSNIDAYIIVTDDYHGSEYVGDYSKNVSICQDLQVRREHFLS